MAELPGPHVSFYSYFFLLGRVEIPWCGFFALVFAKSEMNLELSPLLPNYPKERIDAILGVITQFEQEQVPGLGMDFNVFDWKEHGLDFHFF
jgi:hypothetical protein